MSRGCGASPVALPGGYLSPGRSSGSFSRRVFVAADDGTLARSDSANRAVPDSADVLDHPPEAIHPDLRFRPVTSRPTDGSCGQAPADLKRV